MALDSKQLKEPVLPKEAVPVAELEGEVIVRSLMLDEHLALSSQRARLAVPADGESQDDANARAGAAMVPRTLAAACINPDGSPFWSTEQWRVFGARHPVPALKLFGVAMRLSGQDMEHERKNS